MTAESALAPLDGARAALYRLVTPWLGSWLVDRERRVAMMLVVGVLGGLAGTLLLPFTMLVWAPLILGVPHLFAELRYLVVRPGLHRRLGAWLLVGGPLVAVTFTGDPRLGVAAALGPLLLARAAPGRRALLGLAVGAALLAAWRWPWESVLVLMHGHNAVALALWWAWRPNRPPIQLAGVLLAGGVYLALALGLLDPFVVGWRPFVAGVDLNTLAAEITPGGTLASYHLLLAYVFGQSMHYAAWLRLVPEDDRPRYTPRPFRASLRALRAEFGDAPLWLAFGVFAFFFAWGLYAASPARMAYLGLALFHGYLELALAAWAWVEGRRLSDPAAA